MSETLYIAHHGIKGMRWGVRRYQNPDGSLTPEGRRRYLTTMGDRTDLSKAGNKAVNKYLDKNPGNYRNPLLDNEWEHDFGTSEFAKEVLTKYGNLIDQGKIFTSEFADTYALYKKADDQFNSYVDVAGSQHRRNQREYGKRLNSGEAEADAVGSYKDAMRSFEQDGAHRSEFAKSRNLKTSKDVYNYFKKAVKNLYAEEPGQGATQYMEDAWDMLDRGYITKKTFDKMYDSQLSKSAYSLWENIMENGTPEDYAWLDHWHDIDKSGRNKESSYRKLHNDGHRPSEIAKTLGQSTKDNGKPSGETRKWAAKYKANKNDIAALKARQSRARSLQSSGKTIAEIADIMGAPVSSIKDYLYEDFDSLR